MAVTSYGRNKNHDDEIKKNQEKANNSPSYRCAAIKKGLYNHSMTSLNCFRLLLVLNNDNNTEVLSRWVSRKLLEVQSKLELWQSSLLRSLQLFDWDFAILIGVLLDILKSLNEALSPPVECK